MPLLRLSRCLLVLLACWFAPGCLLHAQFAGPNSDGDEVRGVIVLARHGVRAPIDSETRGGAYNAQPWPAWAAAPGLVTPHGAEALRLLGAYYRARYSGLLAKQSCEQAGLYVEANTVPRTIASAKSLLTGLAPNCALQVHFRAEGHNPLFTPADNSAVDHQKEIDATLGRMADQPDWYAAAFTRQLAKMHHVLVDCAGADCNHATPDFRTIQVKDGIAQPRSARIENPVTLAADFAENLLLEYTEGLPMEQVGWGRVSRADLDDLMELNTRYHDFMLRTPYPAQVAASDLAAHIRDTLLGMASGRAVAGRLGETEDHFIWLDGHDANLTWLGGLLQMDWLLPDQTFNATPPGSALVFELHRSRVTGLQTVQVFFISQTLDQIRNLRPLVGSEQPSVAPVFVPGCSGPAPAFACTVTDFARVLTASVDNRFVEAFRPADK